MQIPNRGSEQDDIPESERTLEDDSLHPKRSVSEALSDSRVYFGEGLGSSPGAPAPSLSSSTSSTLNSLPWLTCKCHPGGKAIFTILGWYDEVAGEGELLNGCFGMDGGVAGLTSV
jgi:hypothetical protein